MTMGWNSGSLPKKLLLMRLLGRVSKKELEMILKMKTIVEKTKIMVKEGINIAKTVTQRRIKR